MNSHTSDKGSSSTQDADCILEIPPSNLPEQDQNHASPQQDNNAPSDPPLPETPDPAPTVPQNPDDCALDIHQPEQDDSSPQQDAYSPSFIKRIRFEAMQDEIIEQDAFKSKSRRCCASESAHGANILLALIAVVLAGAAVFGIVAAVESQMLDKAAPRKAHRERSQLASREHLGLLEKKKDYILRATDFKEKRKKLKQMKEKAAFKNEDEFYFGMINAKTKGGIHLKDQESRLQNFTAEEMALLKTQDKNYVNYQRSINLKKIEKLQSSKHIPRIESDDDDLVEYNDDMMDEEEEEEEEQKKPDPKKANKPTHVIFVDSEKE
ncbi:UTP11-like, U3 small nucleolar ribonucleoprotein, partial [Podochytrium sp. JEL0797]